jgi:hypothetical protein
MRILLPGVATAAAFSALSAACSHDAPAPVSSAIALAPAPPPPAASAKTLRDVAIADAGASVGASDAAAPTTVRASFVVPSGDADAQWIARARRARTFRAVDLPGTATVHLAWQQFAPHKVRDLPPDQDDDPGNYASRLILTLDRGERPVTIELGDRSGAVVPASLTLCSRTGYRLPPDGAWGFPQLADLVSSFTVGLSSGDDDFLVVYAARALHVLHRATSDGMCQRRVHQGPIDTCSEELFERVAEVRISRASDFDETIALGVTSAGSASQVDCLEASQGERLLAPPQSQ